MLRIASALLLLAVSCGGGIRVNTDYDPLASPRMEGYQAWTWLPDPEGAGPQADSTLTRLVTTELERALGAMGYRRDDRAAEFRVGWHAVLAEPAHITEVNTRYGYAFGRWFPGGGVAYSRGFQTDYGPGTLIVDVADARTNELIWRGIARDVFKPGHSVGERAVALNQAVTRVLAQFPPSGQRRQ